MSNEESLGSFKERKYQIMKNKIIDDNGDSMMTVRFSHCLEKDTLTEQVKCIFAEAGKPEEYDHSLRVADNIVKLSEKYNLDKTQTYTAAMLHDTGKIIEVKKRIEFCSRNDMEILDEEKDQPELLHQKISAKLASLLFSIEDEEILNAISIHTTLSSDPGLLGKLLFIADKLILEDEEYREVVEAMNKEVYDNFSADKAISIYLEYLFFTDDDKTLHPWMKNAYKKFNKSLL